MPDSITASVTEPPPRKRPTLYMPIYRDGYTSASFLSTDFDKAQRWANKSVGAIVITIPGHDECARLARIEAARNEVVTAATYARDRAASSGLSYAEFDRLADALSALNQITSESPT